MSKIIPAISLYQPWASWVAEGWKTIETRLHERFKSLEGQRVCIHASMTVDRQAGSTALPWLGMSRAIDTLYFLDIRGVLLCTADVVGVRWLDGKDSKDAMIDCNSVQRFGLFLSNVEKFSKPIPFKGKQGIFKVDLEELAI